MGSFTKQQISMNSLVMFLVARIVSSRTMFLVTLDARSKIEMLSMVCSTTKLDARMKLHCVFRRVINLCTDLNDDFIHRDDLCDDFFHRDDLHPAKKVFEHLR